MRERVEAVNDFNQLKTLFPLLTAEEDEDLRQSRCFEVYKNI